MMSLIDSNQGQLLLSASTLTGRWYLSYMPLSSSFSPSVWKLPQEVLSRDLATFSSYARDKLPWQDKKKTQVWEDSCSNTWPSQGCPGSINFHDYANKKSMFLWVFLILFFNKMIAALHHLKKRKNKEKELEKWVPQPETSSVESQHSALEQAKFETKPCPRGVLPSWGKGAGQIGGHVAFSMTLCGCKQPEQESHGQFSVITGAAVTIRWGGRHQGTFRM